MVIPVGAATSAGNDRVGGFIGIQSPVNVADQPFDRETVVGGNVLEVAPGWYELEPLDHDVGVQSQLVIGSSCQNRFGIQHIPNRHW
ncbi:hypothetical protein AWB89_03840 [Mycobacterium paraense]|nr:hypothetical protein AWB89_03840 [Mycobacterium paraense]